MLKKILLVLLLIPSFFTGKSNPVLKTVVSDPTIYNSYVDEAATLEEQVDTALDHLDLNIDLNNVVTTIKIPTTGLFQSTIVWSSSNPEVAVVDNDNGRVGIIRPALGEQAVELNLTAELTIVVNRDTFLTKSKVFPIRVLPIDEVVNLEEIAPLYEDFNAYATGEEISEYLSWNLTSGQPISEVVDFVPDNNKIDGEKILKINSKKTSSESKYVRRNFYQKGTIAVEAYTMFWGDINGIFFEAGRNDSFGPAFGFDNNYFYYYSNGLKVVDQAKWAEKPTEGIWYKFRMEINTSYRSYSLFVYKMDGSGETIQLCKDTAYSGSEKFINQFRVRAVGGANIGQAYLTSLKIDTVANLPKSEGHNLNRVDGIGVIGYEENILTYIGDESSHITDLVVYNRYNRDELYTVNEDYTVTTSTVSTTENLVILNHEIKLNTTGESRVLTQNIYKEHEDGIPSIGSFKGSHLARDIIDINTGLLSSTGKVMITGTVTRKDSNIYYVLSTTERPNITKEEVLAGGSDFVASGSFAQTTRYVNYAIENLDITKEYFLYVVIANQNGCSDIYSKVQITEVINIATCDDFYDMTVNVTTFKNEFKLINDLDFTGYDWKCDEGNTLRFKGILNGQGYTIKNLNIQSPYRKAAIFFEMEDATIKNLNFINARIEGLQDTAILVGYSYGGTIDNVTVKDSDIVYNGNAGGEGYFAVLIGRVQQGTTNCTNIVIDNTYVESNKYSGAVTGNVNKGVNAVLNIKNIYCETTFNCDGAAIGLIGRNRGTTNLENAVVYLTVTFAKKEMAVVAGHNKEGGELNVKNLIGSIQVKDVTQPTYFNQLIGSQDDNTSKYTYENVAFIKNDYSHLSEELIPTTNTRFAGKYISVPSSVTEKWWEENTFIACFETNSFFKFDEQTGLVTYATERKVTATAALVNEYISLIKNDYSADDHYYITRALMMYNALSATEKAKVNIDTLNAAKANYDSFIASLNDITNIRGGR